MKKYDVGLTGSVAGVDLALAAQLFAAGLSVSILRYNRNTDPTSNWEHNHLKGLSPDCIEYADKGRSVLAWARECRCVISSSGTLAFGLGRWWTLRNFLGLPPVIAKCTGADICELAMQKGEKADRYRESLRDAAVIWGIPYRECIENINHLGHGKQTFVPGAYAGSGQMAGPAVNWAPFPLLLPGLEVPPWARWSLGPASGPLTIFHPTNLECALNDKPADGRLSRKGSDVFIRATLRAMDAGLSAKVHILDRGPDRAAVRRMAERSPHSARFEWHPEMSRLRLLNAFVASDLVVDSFAIGALGFIGLEAMSVSAPVMCYVDRESEAATYSSPAPVFSVSHEDEICQKLLRLERHRQELTEKGREGREWVEKFHGPGAVGPVLRMIQEAIRR